MENNYMNKYLKYKTKYLNLKNSLSVKQTGGNNKSIYSNTIMEINNLTETPTFLEAYGYELEGGDHHSTTLSEKSLDTTTQNLDSNHSASEESVTKSEQSSVSEKLGTEESATKSEVSSVLTGGSEIIMKVSKKNKKNFFDDSDLESSSTDLSSLSSSDSDTD